MHSIYDALLARLPFLVDVMVPDDRMSLRTDVLGLFRANRLSGAGLVWGLC